MIVRYFAFLEKCTDAKACTVILRGGECAHLPILKQCYSCFSCTCVWILGTKDVLNEIERNLQDAMQVVRNVHFDPRMLPGGGATELAVSNAITRSLDTVEGECVVYYWKMKLQLKCHVLWCFFHLGISKWPYAAIATALEVIPRTLAQNCGANVIRLLTELRTKHSQGVEGSAWGVDGTTGVAADMNKLGIWEPYCVKTQTLKTAIESACLILRIDDVVSGTRKKRG